MAVDEITASEDSPMAVVAVVSEMSPEEQEALVKAAEEMEAKRRDILNSLASSVEAKFTERSGRRNIKEQEWVEAMRLYLGTVATWQGPTKEDPHRRASNTQRPDHNIIKQKCKTAIAQSISMQFSGGDKNWDIQPTPRPEGHDYKEAAIAAEAMEDAIHDQLVETDYGHKSRMAMEDRVILGTGILKGPVPSRKARLGYEMVDDGMGNVVHVPTFMVDDKPVIFRVNPWFFFPDDSVNHIDDAEDAIELHPMNKLQLMELKKNPGFFKDAIDEVLALEPQEYRNETFSEYANLTESGINIFKNKYTVLEYHGPITRTQLDALEIEPAFDADNETYFGEVWVCQGVVIRLELESVEGLYELPYCVCPWSKDPGSIFGFGLPMEARDAQRIATAALHMLLDNSSDSSAPSVVVNSSLVEPANGVWELAPGKVWKATDYMLNGGVGNAFQFFNVPNTQNELTAVLQMAREFGQEESGIPLITQGLQSAQVGTDNATGMAILQQASTVVAEFLAQDWDDNITEKIIRRMYHWNMQYNPDPVIKGDFEIDVRSSTEWRNRQLYIRDMEKLSVESAQNPMVAEVVNPAELTRARLAMMHLPSKTIIKSEEQVAQEQQAKAENPPPDPAMIELQLKERELQIKENAQQIELQKLQFDMQQQQQREMWENQERMGAVEARHFESQARIVESERNYQVEMLKLAQKDESLRAQIMADLQKTAMQIDTQKLLGTIQASMKAQDIKLKQDEAQIKREMGTGY